MKNFIFLLVFIFSAFYSYSQISTNFQTPTSINNSGLPPDVSAQLDVDADDRGLLIPRLTTAQRTAIVAPANSLLVYDSYVN